MIPQTSPTTEAAPVSAPPPPQRILLATNGSPAALAAARWLAVHAAHRPAVVTLTYLAGDLRRAGVLDPGPTLAEHVVWQEREYLNALLPAAALRTAVLDGAPEPTLRAAAARADLVVLGSNRVHGRPSLPVPSFSTRVGGAPAVPTVIVPRDWVPAPGPVVLGVDGDDPAVADFAAREAHAQGTALVVTHVRDASRSVGSGEAERRDAERRVQTIVAAMRDRCPGLLVRGEVRSGRTVETLHSAGRRAALLVLGAHLVTPDASPVLGSVGRALIDAPPCPVAVVPAGVR